MGCGASRLRADITDMRVDAGFATECVVRNRELFKLRDAVHAVEHAQMNDHVNGIVMKLSLSVLTDTVGAMQKHVVSDPK